MYKKRSTALALLATILLASNNPAVAEPIRIGGTGMVLGLIQALKGPFEQASPQDQLIVIPGLGSSGGIKALSQQALDVSISGRRLKDREKAINLQLHPFIETPFVIVSNTSIPLELSAEDITTIFSGKSIELEQGVQSRVILRPEGDSVTRLLLQEFDGMDVALKDARSLPGIPVAQTDQENMKLANKVTGSIAAMTLAQFSLEPNDLKLIKVDGVDVYEAMAESGRYKFMANAWVVTQSKISPAVQRFLDFLGSNAAKNVYEKSGVKQLQK